MGAGGDIIKEAQHMEIFRMEIFRRMTAIGHGNKIAVSHENGQSTRTVED
jgi:hypothetical protein